MFLSLIFFLKKKKIRVELKKHLICFIDGLLCSKDKNSQGRHSTNSWTDTMKSLDLALD